MSGVNVIAHERDENFPNATEDSRAAFGEFT